MSSIKEQFSEIKKLSGGKKLDDIIRENESSTPRDEITKKGPIYCDSLKKSTKFEDLKEEEDLYNPRPPGRPKLSPDQKKKTVKTFLHDDVIDYLDSLSFGRGRGTRIEIIINEYQDLQKILKEQAGDFVRIAREVSKLVHKRAASSGRIEEKERVIYENELKRLYQAYSTLMRHYKFRNLEFISKYLTTEQIKNLTFLEQFTSRGGRVQ
ncbi:MAG: hypothetical protein GY909_15795 [Oligoflexia bacterium]|nr:hypothetical protein [Oligoflexia bacterium]